MAIAAADAADRVEQLTTLTERLTELLTEQTRAYEARRPHEAASTTDEAGRLANIYRHESARVKRDPSLLADAPDAAKRRLVLATEAFDVVLARHARVVETALTITEGIVRAVADEVAAGKTAVAGYGPRGRTAAPNSSPIALNRKA